MKFPIILKIRLITTTGLFFRTKVLEKSQDFLNNFSSLNYFLGQNYKKFPFYLLFNFLSFQNRSISTEYFWDINPDRISLNLLFLLGNLGMSTRRF